MSPPLDLSSIPGVTLCVFALGLGARHALDADHVIVIDGFARRNLEERPITARMSGVLFAAGHLLVVLAVSAITASLKVRLQVPMWMATFGEISAASILLSLGILNIRAALRVSGDQFATAVGWKANLFGARTGDSPITIVAIGALFAMSLDTFAVAAALGVAGASVGGGATAMLTAGLFGLGMALVSGFNSVAIVALLRSPSSRGSKGYRLLTGTIGAVNLIVGLMAALTIIGSAAPDRAGGNSLYATLAILVVIGLAFTWVTLANPAAQR